MKRVFNFQSLFYETNSNKSKNKQPSRRLLSPQPSFADESLYCNEDIMIFPATSLLPTKQDLAPKPLVRTKSCDSFPTTTTAEDTPGESCGIKKVPVRLPSSVLANALLPLEISFPNKPLPPMPRQLMENARPIPEPQLDEHCLEDDDDDDDDQMEIVFLPDGKAHRISEPELEEEEHYFEEDDDEDDDQMEIVFLPDETAHRISEPELEEEELYFEEDDDEDDDQVEIVFLPDEKAHHISEPELEEEEHYFEEDDDEDDDQVDIVFLPDEKAHRIPGLELEEAKHHFEEDGDDDDQVEIVFLPDDHLPPSTKTTSTAVPLGLWITLFFLQPQPKDGE
jgi:hypothetical protein